MPHHAVQDVNARAMRSSDDVVARTVRAEYLYRTSAKFKHVHDNPSSILQRVHQSLRHFYLETYGGSSNTHIAARCHYMAHPSFRGRRGRADLQVRNRILRPSPSKIAGSIPPANIFTRTWSRGHKDCRATAIGDPPSPAMHRCRPTITCSRSPRILRPLSATAPCLLPVSRHPSAPPIPAQC